MIEEKLMKKGVSKEIVDIFARLPKHNGKENFFRRICMVNNWEDFRNSLIKSLAEVFAEVGVKDFPELSSNNRKSQAKYLGEEKYKLFISQQIASKMLGTLRDANKQYDENLTLNKIYEETLRKNEKRNFPKY